METDAARPNNPVAGAGCGLLIARVARMAGTGVGRALNEIEMSGHEFAILHRLEQGGSAHGRGLARTLRLHPSNLVALLDQLELEELIERRRDPRDRRRQVIKVTAKGLRRLRQAERATSEAEAKLLSPLSADERRQLRSYLERVAEHACHPSRGWCD